MRMRKKKHGAERLEACSEYLLDKDNVEYKESMMLEIGCGKGAFILETAKRAPETQFIAMELVSDVALLAAEKIKAEGVPNVKFLVANAKTVDEIFKEHSFDRIYLNFSDPWPKAGHKKRRLTYRDYLEKYKRILKGGGAVFFKTDNRGLFDFSLEEFEACGFELKNLTYDLHNSEYNEGNVETEYEKNFSAKGFTINRVEAYVKSVKKEDDE
ncbi:MAG: tRNA (guanosine(46)-N7)-methyltransferase TrmB [Ruminococcaceae bacterium]|nr:tRNA (guanosine(46)-N7)-methyltransferase TrmB [Oscillospiraceae bacterium]